MALVQYDILLDDPAFEHRDVAVFLESELTGSLRIGQSFSSAAKQMQITFSLAGFDGRVVDPGDIGEFVGIGYQLFNHSVRILVPLALDDVDSVEVISVLAGALNKRGRVAVLYNREWLLGEGERNSGLELAVPKFLSQKLRGDGYYELAQALETRTYPTSGR